MEEGEVACPLCLEETIDFSDLVLHLALSHSHKILKFLTVNEGREKRRHEFWIEDDPFDLDYPNFDDLNSNQSQKLVPPVLTRDLHYNLLLAKI